MPSPGASAPRGELGRTQRKCGGTTRGTPTMASNSRARVAFKFLISFVARTHIGTRPHIQRWATRHHPPCLGIEKRMHPIERPMPEERSVRHTQHASHRILGQRRTETPTFEVELKRDKRFCGEPWTDESGGGEPHATRFTRPLPLIVFSATLRGWTLRSLCAYKRNQPFPKQNAPFSDRFLSASQW
jgi:hypothetical protein